MFNKNKSVFSKNCKNLKRKETRDLKKAGYHIRLEFLTLKHFLHSSSCKRNKILKTKMPPRWMKNLVGQKIQEHLEAQLKN